MCDHENTLSQNNKKYLKMTSAIEVDEKSPQTKGRPTPLAFVDINYCSYEKPSGVSLPLWENVCVENDCVVDHPINLSDNENNIEHNISDAEMNPISPTSVNDFSDNESLKDNENDKDIENDENDIEDINHHVILRSLRLKNLNRIIIGHLNINSIRYKFDALKNLIKDNIDILVVSETKIDESFPDSQFYIDGYNIPFRLDRTCDGGGVLVYFRSDIPCKLLKSNLPQNIEGLFIEMNMRNKKWLIFAGYNPKHEHILSFLSHIGNSLDSVIGNFENLILIGDFNCQMEEDVMKDFCDIYDLENLIKEPTCFKNALNPSVIDLILTNRLKCFQNSFCLETGLSDFHKMAVTVLKVHFKKLRPNKIKYRSYKHFDINAFKDELKTDLETNIQSNINYDVFKEIFMNILNKYAPIKSKLVRGNNAPFMNKTLSKSFMQRAKLKNKYNKTPTEINHFHYRKQRNYCTNLLKKVKKEYYNNLNLNIFKDNKTFWKNIRPLFSDRNKGQNNIILIDKEGTIASNETEVAEKLNNYFIDVIENLEIETFIDTNEPIEKTNKDETGRENEVVNNIETLTSKYGQHPSILKIKEHVKITQQFSFSKLTSDELASYIISLDPKKASVENDIPTKILIDTKEITSEFLSKIYQESIENQIFPVSLKQADIIPVHKQLERTMEKNYRPISLLPSISKIYERDMYNQILAYVEQYLSPYLFGFRKDHNTEQCLNVMIETWKKALDKKQYAGAVLTDLSKAFDCINHELLIAKLEAYGFSHEALHFIYNYLSDRTQRTKVKSSYSSYRDIKYGVPQGSILGPLLFNIFINDIFLFVKDTKITNYADDNTPYAVEDSIEKLLETLQKDVNILLNWFKMNEMKPNADKSHLFIVNSIGDNIKIGNDEITGENSVKLLGITIDNKLSFNEHAKNICKKANQKLYALSRIAKYIQSDKLRIIMKAFIDSQFNYCSLTWMFHSRQINAKINKLHERALRIVYKDQKLTFEQLLVLDKSHSIHHRNLQKLAVEMFKVKHNMVPAPLQELFPKYDNVFNLRNQRCWQSFNIRTVGYGIDTLAYRGEKTWQLLPDFIRNSNTLSEFIFKIKKWNPHGCTCRLCKTYIHNVGYI